MNLLDKQQLFSRLVGTLLVWIYQQDTLAVTFGDFNRPDQKGHMANSLHYIRLAADLNLFVDGVFQQGDCPAWQAIGAKGKSLNPLCAWGGDFKSRDENHFSLMHEGRE